MIIFESNFKKQTMMNFQNLSINQSLSNGLIENLKENPDLIGFIMAGLDRGFKAELPGSVLMKYGKIIIGCHTAGDDRKIWIAHAKIDKVLKLFVWEKFDWSAIEILKGGLYYNHKFICKTQ